MSEVNEPNGKIEMNSPTVQAVAGAGDASEPRAAESTSAAPEAAEPETVELEAVEPRAAESASAEPPTAEPEMKRFPLPAVRSILPEKIQNQRVPAEIGDAEGAASGAPAAAQKKKRVKQPFSNKKIIFFSFLIPFLALAFAYACNTFYPIGNKTPLTIDLYHQYAPFLAELRGKILGGESFFYSWNTGLGANFYALLAYYAASPLNLILVLFPPAFLTEAVTLLTLLKIGLIGASFAALLLYGYCPYKLRTIGSARPADLRYTSQVGTDWMVILTASAFALSGFMISYSWDIMWLDAIIFLPLVLLGLLRLLTQGRFLLYVLSLAACIMVNYYIALFVCLFTALYFFVAYFSFESESPQALARPLRHFLLRAFQFTAASLLAAGVAAVLAWPTYLALQVTSATRDAFPSALSMRFSIFDFLQRQLIGGVPAIREGLPNIYAGVLSVLMLPLYIFCGEIKLKEKLWHLGLLFLMFLSFSNNYLDFIWHGLHYPNQLPFRYAFVYSALLLIISFRALSFIRLYPKKLIAASGFVAVLYALLAEEVLKDKLPHSSVYLSVAFFVVYVALLSLFGDASGRRGFRNLSCALALLVVTELLLNTLLQVVYIHKNEYYTSRSDFNNDIPQIRGELAWLNQEDPGFWRMEIVQQKTTNSPALYGYRGITLFSSTSYEKTAQLMRKLGYHGNNINSYKYMASTDLMNAILGVKYLINKEGIIPTPLLEEIKTDEKLHIYRNPLALPLGFVVDERIYGWNTSSISPFAVQNDFVRSSGQERPVFEAREIAERKATNYSLSDVAEQGVQAGSVNVDASGSVEFVIQAKKSEQLYFFVSAAAEMQVGFKVRAAKAVESSPSVSAPSGSAKAPASAPSATVAGALSTHTFKAGAEPPNAGDESAASLYSDDRSVNVPEIFDCGYVEEGQTVEVKITTKEGNSKSFNLYAVASDHAALAEAVAFWRRGELRISDFSADRLSADVTAEKDGALFLSIPYDEAWEAEVDGQRVLQRPIGGGLMALPLSAGEHHLNLRFVPPGFRQGGLLSLLSLALLALGLIVHQFVKKRRMRAKNPE